MAALDFITERRLADGPSRRPNYEGEEHAGNQLLPSLQKKLSVWERDPCVAPMVGRIRVSGAPRVARMTSATSSPFLWSKSSIRTVVNKISEREPLLGAPADEISWHIQKLQAKQPELIEQCKRMQEAGEAQFWRESGGLWCYDDKLYAHCETRSSDSTGPQGES